MLLLSFWQPPVEPFDWERMFIDQFPWLFLGEVAFRTVFMFFVLLTALTVSGKREVRQLSIYELVLVIGLGSAAGDPMFYHDVPLSAAVVVFVVMMGCYKLVTYINDRNPTLRRKIEGKPVYIVEEGRILLENLEKEDITFDDLASDMRVAGVEQLGQVRAAILEPNGRLAVFQYNPGEAVPGLPLMPRDLDRQSRQINTPGTYACTNCGTTVAFIAPVRHPVCPGCQQHTWVMASRSSSRQLSE